MEICILLFPLFATSKRPLLATGAVFKTFYFTIFYTILQYFITYNRPERNRACSWLDFPA
jgi:hypothetical protein